VLDEAQREELRQLMEASLQEAARDVARLKDLIAPVAPDPAIGRLTRMEAIQSKSISEANLRKAQSRQTSLKRALRRLEEDEEFGICDGCEEPIPYKRILLVPSTTRCVGCAEKSRPR
jgi:DnaK suppressor protein